MKSLKLSGREDSSSELGGLTVGDSLSFFGGSNAEIKIKGRQKNFELTATLV